MTKYQILFIFLISSMLHAVSITNFSSNGGFNFNLLSTPPSDISNVNSNTAYSVFEEKNQFTLPIDIDLDIDTPGTFGNPSGGAILAGTVVDSMFIFFNPSSGTVSLNGTFTFDRDIIGIQALSGILTNSHGVLGAPGTIYGGAQIGITGSDRITLTPDLRTIVVSNSASGIDNFRVIFASENEATVPEPSSILLFAMSLLMVSSFRKTT